MECTVHLLAGMPACYICRQQEGRQAELPKGRRDFKMATLDVTEDLEREVEPTICIELKNEEDEG